MSSVLKSPLQPTSRKPTECSNSSCTTCNKPSYLNANASAPRILARCGTREPDSPITKAEIPSHKNYVALGFSLSIRAKLRLIFLKVKLQRQLNLAHGGRCRGNLTESRYRRRTRTAPPAYAGWTGQFHMVGSVEHLHAELKVPFFGDLEKLDDRNIFVPAPRSPQGVAAAVAKRARYGIGECRRVPPAVLVGIGQYRIDAGSAVQPGGVGNEIGAPGIPCGRVDHAAALQRGDGAQLPVAHHLVYDPSMVEKFLAFTERQRVEDGSD